MATLDFNSVIRTTAGGQTTSTIVTANNIGSYAPALNSTYYIGTTQNVFNRASASQTLTGVSIDGNAANITAYTINQNVGTGNTPSFAGLVSSAVTNYAFLQVTDTNNFWITPGNNNWGLYFETSAGGLLGGTGDSNRLGFVGAGAARFYVDLNNGNGWFGGSLTANTDSRAPIFYDTNNTAYFCDPSSTSNLNVVTLNNSGSGGYLNLPGSISVSNVSGAEMVIRGLSQLRFSTSTSWDWNSWAGLKYDNAATTIYLGGPAATGIFTQNATPPTVTVSFVGTSNVTSDSNFKAPIFYDSNDTNYYLDAAGTSRLNTTRIGNINVGSGTYLNTITPIGDTNINLSSPSGAFYFDTFPRMPGFYDSNDTNYYVDPASTSVLNRLKVDGGNFVNDYYQSISDFTNGTLVTTDIDASVASGDSFVMNVIGKSYNTTTSPFNFSVQGYLYNSTIINYSGLSLDSTGLSTIKIFNNGGFLCFWWARVSYWNAFEVSVRAYNSTKANYNRVTNVTDSTEPVGSKKVTVTLQSFLRADVSATNSVDLRAPIFYDSNDTTYYTDPSSLSNILELKTNKNWYDNSASAWGGGINMGGNNPSIGFQSTASTWWYMLHHSSSAINFYRRSTSGSWNQDGIWDSSGNLIWQGSSVRGQIFYDNNNTSYYVDPASTSNLVGLTVANTITGSITGNAGGSSASCTGNAATATRTSSQSGYPHAGTGMFAFYNWGGSDGGTSAPSASTYTTGLSVGSNPGDQAYGFQIANNMWNTGLWTRNYNSSFGAWIRLLDSSNYVGYSAFTSSLTSTVDARAPIFYDSNNTAYYVDPASTGYSAYFAGAIQATKIGIEDGGIDCYMEITDANPVIYGVTYGGEFIFYGDKSTPASFLYYGGATVTYTLQANSSLRAPIFYDSNDTTYYLDPANTGTSLLVAGSVGVGTTSASTKLHVAGTTGLYQSAGNTYLYYDHQGVNTWRTGIFTDNTSTYIIGHDSGGTFATKILAITMAGNVGIGTTSPSYKLQVNGSFAATTKSFDIPHPTKENKRLVYASLEGPENGVYVRGKNKTNIIELPDYWIGLVHEDSLSVSLTPIGKNKNNKIRNYSVELIENNKVYIYTDSKDNIYDYYYIIHAERKDVPQLIVEKEIN